MEIGFFLALIVLICLVIALAYRIDSLEGAIKAERHYHTSCHTAVGVALTALQRSREGKVLREAARRWESPSERARIMELGRHRQELDPPVPTLWLNALAEEAEGMTDCAGHEHTLGGECLIFKEQ